MWERKYLEQSIPNRFGCVWLWFVCYDTKSIIAMALSTGMLLPLRNVFPFLCCPPVLTQYLCCLHMALV